MAGIFKAPSTNQDLWFFDPVIIELQLCPAISAEEMAELMVPARMSVLDPSTGTVVRNCNKVSGVLKWTCLTAPILHDANARRLHPRSLTNILKMNRSWIADAQFYPPLLLHLSGDAGRERTMRELLEHLDDQYYVAYATTLTFQSSVINLHLKQFVGCNEAPNDLPQPSANTTSIMHCGALRPLEASALTSSSTIHLITSVRVYIMYPPTPNNMMTVQSTSWTSPKVLHQSMQAYVAICKKTSPSFSAPVKP